MEFLKVKRLQGCQGTSTFTKLVDTKFYDSCPFVMPGQEGARRATGRPGGLLLFQTSLQITEPVRTALDIEHMTAMQQPVKQSGGHHLVTGDDLCPVTY